MLRVESFPWRRCWSKIHDNPSSSSNRTGEIKRGLEASDQADGVLLIQLTDIQCLVLLGIPGMGKTHAIYEHAESLTTQFKSDGNILVLPPIDLGAYGDEAELRQRIFQNPVYQIWRQGTAQLFLFLDGLDESPLQQNALPFIIDQLKSEPLERLHLRIACRTSEWLPQWTRDLEYLWDNRFYSQNSPVELYEIMPLTTDDIKLAATQLGLDEKFEEEIGRLDAWPLAQHPISFQFLSNLYLETRRFPTSRADLYLEGIRYLAREPNPKRRKLTFETETNERLEVATFLAGVMLLSQRYAIYYDAAQRGKRSTDLTVSELIALKHEVSDTYLRDELPTLASGRNDAEFQQLFEKLLHETLSSALFTGEGIYTWVHRSYLEFLAARYLLKTGTKSKTIIRLVTENKKIIPQLEEMIAWLAEMNSSVFREMLHRNLLILLRVDFSKVSNADFDRFFDQLCQYKDKYLFLYLRDRVRSQLLKLNHPLLETKIRPYLNNPQSNDFLVQFLLVLSRENNLKELGAVILKIVLTASYSEVTRRIAAYTLTDIGSPELLKQLKPLIFGVAGDNYDELKGEALLALWPNYITAVELFQALTPPQNDNFLGSYRLFFAVERIVTPLQVGDLPIALRWIETQPELHELEYFVRPIVDAILRLAWGYCDRPEILKAFSEAVISRLELNDVVFGTQRGYNPSTSLEISEFLQKFRNATDKRHKLIESLLPLMIERKVNPIALFMWTPIVISDDVFWLIAVLNESNDPKVQEIYATLIERLFIQDNADVIEAVYKAQLINPILAQKVGLLFSVQAVSGAEADKARQDQLELKRFLPVQLKTKKRHQYRKPILGFVWPEPSGVIIKKKRFIHTLARIEKGNIQAWLKLVFRDLLVDSKGHRQPIDHFYADLTELPGWNIASEDAQKRIVVNAKTYVTSSNPVQSLWITGDQIPNEEWAGYLALYLLLRYDKEYLTTLPTDIWAHWIQIIVWFPIASSTQVNFQQELLTLAYRQCPELFLQFLNELLTTANTGDILRRVGHLWDDKFADFLTTKIKTFTFSLETLETVLDELLKHDIMEARLWALEFIRQGYNDEASKQRLATVASTLASSLPSITWSEIWKLMEQDQSLADLMVERWAADRSTQFIEKLATHELAELYIWLGRHYPRSNDMSLLGTFTGGKSERIRQWCENILSILRNRRTEESTIEIQRISTLFPDHAWLQMLRIETGFASKSIVWEPHTPTEVIGLMRHRSPFWRTVWNSMENNRVALLIAIILAVIGMAVSVASSEIRRAIGLDKTEFTATVTTAPSPIASSTPPTITSTAIASTTPVTTPKAVSTLSKQ